VTPASTRPSSGSNRAAIGWGIVVGVVQAATPLLFWWLDGSTVYALGLAVIAAIYVGFAVSDGRVRVIAVETGVAFAFVLVGAAAVTGTPWLLVAGFCMTVDWVLAAIIVVEIAAGLHFQ
jgi:hypothetical protein